MENIQNMTELSEEDMYCRMLDALLEYVQSMNHEDLTKRDFSILEAIVEFYGFDQELLNDFLNQATELLERDNAFVTH